jgi:hypothetical protein
MVTQKEAIHAASARGLSSHVRRLSKSNQGISRWLAVAVLAGSVVALAMVHFAIH